METIIRIAELIGAVIAGGWITRIITIRARVRQEKAGAAKAEAEADENNIDNIRKTMEEVYKPIIDDLTRQVEALRKEVKEVREENEVVLRENRELKQENCDLRDVLRQIRPDLVPSRKSEKARHQSRNANGQFVREEGPRE